MNSLCCQEHVSIQERRKCQYYTHFQITWLETGVLSNTHDLIRSVNGIILPVQSVRVVKQWLTDHTDGELHVISETYPYVEEGRNDPTWIVMTRHMNSRPDSPEDRSRETSIFTFQ